MRKLKTNRRNLACVSVLVIIVKCVNQMAADEKSLGNIVLEPRSDYGPYVYLVQRQSAAAPRYMPVYLSRVFPKPPKRIIQ